MRSITVFIILGLLFGFGGYAFVEPSFFFNPSTALALIWLLAEYKLNWEAST